MKKISNMSQVELAAFIQTHLATKGIDAILSGGAAVAYYVGNKYVSMDIDLVLEWIVTRSKLNMAMQEIGFNFIAKYYEHEETPFIVEVLGDLPTVGNQPIRKPHEKLLKTGTLRVISPTDCAKDRLAAFYHWGDTEVLEQAILLAKSQTLDFDDLKKWSIEEGKEVEYKIFLSRI